LPFRAKVLEVFILSAFHLKFHWYSVPVRQAAVQEQSTGIVAGAFDPNIIIWRDPGTVNRKHLRMGTILLTPLPVCTAGKTGILSKTGKSTGRKEIFMIE